MNVCVNGWMANCPLKRFEWSSRWEVLYKYKPFTKSFMKQFYNILTFLLFVYWMLPAEIFINGLWSKVRIMCVHPTWFICSYFIVKVFIKWNRISSLLFMCVVYVGVWISFWTGVIFSYNAYRLFQRSVKQLICLLCLKYASHFAFM